MANKLYILVSSDLTKSQQAVQACHVVAEFMKFDDCRKQWPNETIVLLKVNDLPGWFHKMDDISESWIEFFEPDLDDKLTAIAAWGPQLESVLKNLPLL